MRIIFMLDKLIPVVFSTDHRYVMPTGVALHSLLKQRGNYVIYIFVDTDVTPEDKVLLEKEVSFAPKASELNFLNYGSVFQDSFACRYISKASYARFLIPWILPQYDKVIYCDQDIIFKTSLTEVYQRTSLESAYLAAVIRERGKETNIYKYIESLGLDPRKYINAGFLIINSRLMRQHNLLPRFMELSKKKFLYMDQDILNLVCDNKIVFLPPYFNITPEEVTPENMERGCIIHYTGEKPWESFRSCWLEWWDNYRESVFYSPEFYFTVSKKIMSDLQEGRSIPRKLKKWIINLYKYPIINKLITIINNSMGKQY